jgi:hypothetical protein
MEPQSGCSLPDFSDLLPAQHRSDCNKGKSETNSIFPDPLVWVCDALAADWIKNVCINIPTTNTDSKSTQKSKREILYTSSSHSSDLTKTVVVSGSTKSVNRFSKGTTHDKNLSQIREQFIHQRTKSLHRAFWKISKDKDLRTDFLRNLKFEIIENSVSQTKRIPLKSTIEDLADFSSI